MLEASPSTGWRETCELLHVNPDQLAAATRRDRPPRYRLKHLRGVTS